MTGIEVRIGGAAAAAEGDPFGVEALELVGEAVALGGGEVQGRELDAEDLVPEAERDLTDLVGGAAQGAVPDVSTTGGAWLTRRSRSGMNALKP